MHTDLSSLIHKFHNLSWITEMNFSTTLIYWDAPLYSIWSKVTSFFFIQYFLLLLK